MNEATIRHELTQDERDKLGSHAGHLAHEIALKRIARKDAMDAAKLKISDLEAELDQALKELHDGFRLEPAQAEIDFNNSVVFKRDELRLDEVKDVVRKAKEKYASEAESFEDNGDDGDEQPESDPVVEKMPADDLDSELIDAAIKLRDSGERLTTSVLRRRLRIGKAKAQRIFDALQHIDSMSDVEP